MQNLASIDGTSSTPVDPVTPSAPLPMVDVVVSSDGAFAYLNGHYFVSGAQNRIAVSTDGSNFTVTLPNYASPDVNAYFSNITQFAVGNGIVVGVAYERIVTSSNMGSAWTNQDNFFGYGAGGPDDTASI